MSCGVHQCNGTGYAMTIVATPVQQDGPYYNSCGMHQCKRTGYAMTVVAYTSATG